MAYVGYWFRSVAIDVLLSFNFEFDLSFNVFPFPPFKAISKGDFSIILAKRGN
jgi:hypothetical protein